MDLNYQKRMIHSFVTDDILNQNQNNLSAPKYLKAMLIFFNVMKIKFYLLVDRSFGYFFSALYGEKPSVLYSSISWM